MPIASKAVSAHGAGLAWAAIPPAPVCGSDVGSTLSICAVGGLAPAVNDVGVWPYASGAEGWFCVAGMVPRNGVMG